MQIAKKMSLSVSWGEVVSKTQVDVMVLPNVLINQTNGTVFVYKTVIKL